mgnify:CR=1 FL=1
MSPQRTYRKKKKLFLFDVDGVIKLGDTLIDGALDLFNYIKDSKLLIFFIGLLLKTYFL